MIVRRTVGALLALGLVVAGATSASGHDTLLGSDPADGAVLTTAPAQVVLTFSADQLALGTAVTVTGPDGADRADGAPVVEGSAVTQPLAGDLPGGAYTVLWRSVSGDGHPVEGTLTFTLDLPEPVAPADEQPVAEPAGDEVDAAAAAPSPAAAETAAAAGQDADPQVDKRDVGASPLEWLVAGLAVLGLVGVALAVALRRRGGDR